MPDRITSVLNARIRRLVELRKKARLRRETRLFLIEGKKGSKPFMKIEPQLYIRSEDGFTDELKKIYAVGKEQ